MAIRGGRQSGLGHSQAPEPLSRQHGWVPIPEAALPRGTMGDQVERLEEAALGITGPAYVDPPLAELAAGSPRIMVVDDDDGFRTMIRDWLSEEGLSDIDEARDGA